MHNFIYATVFIGIFNYTNLHAVCSSDFIFCPEYLPKNGEN